MSKPGAGKLHKPHFQLLAALVLGAVSGVLLHNAADGAFKATLDGLSTGAFAAIGQVFLRMIFMVVVPMVFAALVLGVYELGQGHALGRVALKTLAYTLIASAASVVIGITLVNVLKPGAGFEIGAFSQTLEAQSAQVQTIQKNAGAAKPFLQSLVEIIPRNPLDSAVRALDGEMIALMFFALIFGLALSFTLRGEARPEGDREPVVIELLQQIFGAAMKIVSFAMRLAPLAVFCLVFNTAYRFGHEIFVALLYYVAVVVLGLAIQQFGVYSILLKTIARRNPLDFYRRCREVYLYAFSTASSNATLPKTLAAATHELGLKPEISRFVLTVGSTANQNGTALFEGITVLFLAQVYGVDLSFAQQIQVVLMSILAGVGTAGVPGGSLPLIMILLQQVGIPAEGMGLILGVDRFLDMCRTTLNVSGDLVIAALVDHETGTQKASAQA